ncbi:IS630 family transposase [Methylocaldum sp.]|uniref:IS630 family transposase n=1 Tax=Methylocaldum sp. TaxID=1969727 RepID=UPI002D319E3F|nr:IS630 family transposase [Methylocaldum sp.]HYE34168.1 IS630 family transposase [Methylocaldum sp.]
MEKKLPKTLAEVVQGFEGIGPIRLMFQDEARFGRIADTRRCWCPKPFRPLVKAMITQDYTYAYAAVSPRDGRLDSLILPHVNGACMHLFLEEIASRYPNERIVMVVDGAGWHKSGQFPLPSNLRLLPLPPYAPELNPVEHLWDELREKSFHNRVFDSLDALEDHLEHAVRDLENDPARVYSITAWSWIINAL